MSHKIGIIGTGYVGLVSGACFAATGNQVLCVDIDKEKINMLKNSRSPIFEPGLEYLLEQNIDGGRLHFTTNLEEAVESRDVIFLCLPTPPNEDGSADLQHVLRAAENIAKIIKEKNITEKRIVINKSTVPVGTAEKTRNIFRKHAPGYPIYVASNPEFLREGFAVEDSMKPERVVVGYSDEYVKETLTDLYQPFVRTGNPIIVMDEKSAEITKYAANSFLAVKISFMNDLSQYCERVGADIENIRYGIGADSRIGSRFLFAGLGYGGSCFPKDVRAILYSTEQAGVPLKIVSAAREVNENQRKVFFEKIWKRFNGKISGIKFALWGMAFKPNTDDTRESPAFWLIEQFLEAGAEVAAFDPEATENAKKRFGDAVDYKTNMYDCLDGAEALIIATEWNIFRKPDFDRIKGLLNNPLIFDGRNQYEPEKMRQKGFEYHCVGRAAVSPE